MKIGITGAGGQLGRELSLHLGSVGFTVIAFSRQELDICNVELLNATLVKLDLDFLVNCAAFTDVDSAENKPATAFQTNAEGPANLAKVCKLKDIGFIHISTDSVFSSNTPEYFKVANATNPINVYGLSKEAGEKAILKEYPERSWIIRTAWIYGNFGGKFVHAIMEKAEGDQAFAVVDDQFGQPISTSALASYIGAIVRSEKHPGIYHFASTDYVSRFEFARTIFSILNSDPERVLPVSTIPSNFVAKRPKYSLLDTTESVDLLEIGARSWKDYLTTYLQDAR
jgi:dTDP-4-dehydrorhamnose reductase